jgi:4-amino-4-deoxy-L-arabinose transferase-like glycosyltransferase
MRRWLGGRSMSLYAADAATTSRGGHRQARRLKLLVLVIVSALAVLRIAFPERPMDYVGPRALLDEAFALALLGFVLLVATGLGLKVLRWLRIHGQSDLDRVVFSTPLGLGILAYVVLGLGFMGLFRPVPILLSVGAGALWAAPECGRLLDRASQGIGRVPIVWRGLNIGEKAVLAAAGLFLLVTVPQALMPPWDWDGLMYHLEAPRLFLQAGRIYSLPDVWTANYPLTMEMLYTIGLVLGTDIFAKLLNLATGVYLVLATFVFGRQYLGRLPGWVAAAVLIGVPILVPETVGTFVDLAWALFEFLAVCCVAAWRYDGRSRWLVLGGLYCGLSLGTKYIALVQVGLLGLWVLWQSRRLLLKSAMIRAATLDLVAAAVALPWYLRNWLWAGNPVYPLAFGGAAWPAERLQWLNTFLGSFGTGRGPLDYLLLPWNIYARSGQFGNPLSVMDTPSVLFLLAFLYPLRRRGSIVDWLAVLAAARFVAWAAGVQVTRYLVAVFPAVSIITAAVLCGLTNVPALRRAVLVIPLGAAIAVTLIYQSLFAWALESVPFSLGLQSKHQFLTRFVPAYRLQNVVQTTVAPQSRILVLWDGRGYYRDDRHVLDVEQSRWPQMVSALGSTHAIAAELKAIGVTHIIFSVQDARWIIENHDPTRSHMLAADFFWETFVPACGRELYHDKDAYLFEITCQ